MTPAILRSRLLATSAAIAIVTTPLSAQTPPPVPDTTLDQDDRVEVIARTSRLLADRYVFPDVAKACGAHLRKLLETGEFDGVSDPDAFATLLTESLQSVSHDKHMRVRFTPPPRARVERADPGRAAARRLERLRRENYGFYRVERLDGNVGYLDLRFFSGSPRARPTAVAAMNFLANTDAIIFDMRNNGGGNPEMIRFLCSYLFDEPTHLNSLYWRQGDRTEEFWTTTDVPGPLMTEVPVFVLTSSSTFSGAEEFSYNLRTRERAVLIGETTGGGANPGGTMPINRSFAIFIPTGRAINPVTGTNWEGVGVVPHIETDAEEAYDRGIELASQAAEDHRQKKRAALDVLWIDLTEAETNALDLIEKEKRAEAGVVVLDAVVKAQGAGLLGEADINRLGYEWLGREQTLIAIALFKFNVEVYPESFNVYDSLGEGYMVDGRTGLAIKFYRKSLEVDPANTNAHRMIERMTGDGL